MKFVCRYSEEKKKHTTKAFNLKTKFFYMDKYISIQLFFPLQTKIDVGTVMDVMNQHC